MADVYWSGFSADKLYLQSGEFTSTLKTSQAVGSIDTLVVGISWDLTNTVWSGLTAAKIYIQSGNFTATLKDSTSTPGIRGNSTDVTNTPWSSASKMFLQSGRSSATIKTSQSLSGVSTLSNGISFDGTDTPVASQAPVKLFKLSGQFTITIKESFASVNGPTGISWNGTDVLWESNAGGAQKLFLQSAYTSTLKTSEDVSSVETAPFGIENSDFDVRLGIVVVSGSIIPKLMNSYRQRRTA